MHQIDLGTHTIFVGDVVASEVLHPGSPLTYRYYHEHIKGRTPPKAPSYSSEKDRAEQSAKLGAAACQENPHRRNPTPSTWAKGCSCAAYVTSAMWSAISRSTGM